MNFGKWMSRIWKGELGLDVMNMERWARHGYGMCSGFRGAGLGGGSQFGRPAQKRLGFQRSPATSSILRQPAIDRTAVDPQGSRDNLGAFASLYAAHGADAHLFQRRVVQLASIVLSHLPSESDEFRPVNSNVELLMD